jgi:hypothetical protein
MEELFARDLQIKRIIAGLELYSGQKIIAGKTLLIFDELQEVPGALGSLKYFNEDFGEYDIIAACSLMGIALYQGTSFPVGKVEFLRLYPSRPTTLWGECPKRSKPLRPTGITPGSAMSSGESSMHTTRIIQNTRLLCIYQKYENCGTAFPPSFHGKTKNSCAAL